MSDDSRLPATSTQAAVPCPSGSDEFDVSDNTGNLCIDRNDSSH
jgi:hypothetical protein